MKSNAVPIQNEISALIFRASSLVGDLRIEAFGVDAQAVEELDQGRVGERPLVSEALHKLAEKAR